MNFLKTPKKIPSKEDIATLHMVILFYFVGVAVKVMQVDSEPNEQEFNCLYEFFPKTLNLRSKISLLYKDAIKEKLSTPSLVQKIKNASPDNHSLYKEICVKLIALADSDFPINKDEFKMITEIAGGFGFSKEEVERWIREYITEPSGDDYEILNVNKFSSLQDINDSHRELVMKYHPDKLFAHNDILDICIDCYKEKYTLVSNAYKNLKSFKREEKNL